MTDDVFEKIRAVELHAHSAKQSARLSREAALDSDTRKYHATVTRVDLKLVIEAATLALVEMGEGK